MNEDTKFPSDLADRFQLRMPSGMRERLAEVAKANGRSMNAEAVMALEAWLSGGASEGILRIPDDRLTRLKTLAATSGRTVEAEVDFALMNWVEVPLTPVQIEEISQRAIASMGVTDLIKDLRVMSGKLQAFYEQRVAEKGEAALVQSGGDGE